MLLILQNSINAFSFTPTISLKDAMAFIEQQQDLFISIVGYIYGVAVFTAPYCTLAVVYKVLERMLRIAFGIRRKKGMETIVIFGYNNDVTAMLNHYSQDNNNRYFIHIVTDADFSPENRYKLSRGGYKMHSFDILNADEKELAYLLKKSGVNEAKNIIIFGDNSINNFSILQTFSLRGGDGKYKLREGTKITCRCEDSSIAELISDYYRVENGQTYGYDLEIVSLPELQVRKMYGLIPLHSYYSGSSVRLEDRHTRLALLGFGKLGQQALLQAVNLSVVHRNNRVVIDVFDSNVKEKMNVFTNRFSSDTFESEGKTLKLKSCAADGSLVINFRETNVRYRNFAEIIKAEHMKLPYTYVVVSINDIDTCVGCAMRLSDVFADCDSHGIPIILRMDSDRRLAQYIGDNEGTFADVRILEKRSLVITLDLILNKDISALAKEFHHFYSNIQIVSKGEKPWGTSDDTADELWRKTSMFKRQSSKALAAHSPIKTEIIEQLARELGIPDVDKKIDELIGEHGSLMTFKDGVWYLNESDDAFVTALKNDRFAYEFAAMEHRRWCSFVASDGWRNGEQRNDRRKIHTCLVTFDQLARDEKGKTTIKYDLMALMVRYLEKHKNN